MDTGADSYRRYRAGDDEGLVEIIREYRDGVVLFLDRYVDDLTLAEELAEETFFRLAVKKPLFAPRGTFKTWLYTIARNVALDHLRRDRSLAPLPPEEAEAETVAELLPEAAEDTDDDGTEKSLFDEDDTAPEAAPAPDPDGDKKGLGGLLTSAKERIGEGCGDAAAQLSRSDLVNELKTSRESRWVAAGAILAGVAVILLVLTLVGHYCGFCVLFHRYQSATCAAPATCTVCGRTKGEPLPHDYAPATCTEAETCTVCGATRGEPLGHDWQEADCTRAKHCLRCEAIEGEKLEHTAGEAVTTLAPTVNEPGKEEVRCTLCGEVMETRDVVLDSYVEEEHLAYSVLDYIKLLHTAKDELLPELEMLVLTDGNTGIDSYNLWLDTAYAQHECVASCVLYDSASEPMKIDGAGEDRVYVLRWTLARPYDADTCARVLPLILRSLCPTPIDSSTLMTEGDMTVGGIRYIYENDGTTLCRLTALTGEFCGDASVAKLFA